MTLDLLLWAVLPYVTITVLVGGTAWRYRYDRFGWTTRSSQLHESRLLRVGSPLFHLGLLLVLAGHVGGLLVPASVTRWLGLHDEAYHLVSLTAGGLAGAAALVGLGVLLHRRLRTPAVRAATSRGDRLTFPLLALVLLLGMTATVLLNGVGGGYDYRETVSPWVRGVLLLHPDPALMHDVPLVYRLHALAAMALFALWPFSRLVHAFSAPLHYLVRPYIVYRGRDDRLAARPAPRGWDDR
ncbi:respiratory nitrate reductase subunit gamma [Saccharothrix syringae]|uniref:Nitrate reductase-like protein NarX n=1 Tax=Saccharothrix syringae TaxID=103733 RepID=A0A5Q0H0S9_SACSY|nr:respiratory nitrate reductase subunit gamma [Saccharothrix syringae]QFZ19788.1 respiratory nitrate reductase subunit gamma [Saccharothrix syringae]